MCVSRTGATAHWARVFKFGAGATYKLSIMRPWSYGQGIVIEMNISTDVQFSENIIVAKAFGVLNQTYSLPRKVRLCKELNNGIATGMLYIDFYLDGRDGIITDDPYGFILEPISSYNNNLKEWFDLITPYDYNTVPSEVPSTEQLYLQDDNFIKTALETDFSRTGFVNYDRTVNYLRLSSTMTFYFNIGNTTYLHYQVPQDECPIYFIIGYPYMMSSPTKKAPCIIGLNDSFGNSQIIYQSETDYTLEISRIVSGGVPYIQYHMSWAYAAVFLFSTMKISPAIATGPLTPDE